MQKAKLAIEAGSSTLAHPASAFKDHGVTVFSSLSLTASLQLHCRLTKTASR